MHYGKRPGAGRKPISIDLAGWEKLCWLRCTYEEMAAFFDCSVNTIKNYAKKWEYAEAMARGRARAKIAMRRLLEDGNAIMAIWLGKGRK